MSVSIELDPVTFEASGGSLTGEIWLDVDGHAFPAARWNDFVVVILGWWLAEVASLRAHRGQATLRFMDGPWWFEVDASEDTWRLTLMDGHGRAPHAIHSGDVTPEELEKALLRATAVVERRCTELGWSSRDREALQRNRDSLKTLRNG